MELATPNFAREVVILISRLHELPGAEQKELELARQFGALPIGFDFAFHFIRPDGTAIYLDPPHAPEFASDPQSSLRAMVYASERYPSLVQFVPPKPHDAKLCELCAGSGVLGNVTSGRCGNCAGLGWVVSGA